MTAPHKIPEEEYKQRVRVLINKLISEGSGKSETKELFELYNDRMTPRATKMYCGGCRVRVYNRMKAYYETIKEE
jgi:hypothetical protein